MWGAHRRHDILARAHDMLFLVVGDSGGNALFDIEAPCELMQFASRELGDVYVSALLRRLANDTRGGGLLAGVVPEIEPTVYEEKEGILEGNNEGAAVELEERKRSSGSSNHRNQGRRYKKGQYAPDNVASAEPAAYIDELFEREGAEDLVFDLDELRDLELHGSIISVHRAALAPYSGRRLSVRVVVDRFAGSARLPRFVRLGNRRSLYFSHG